MIFEVLRFNKWDTKISEAYFYLENSSDLKVNNHTNCEVELDFNDMIHEYDSDSNAPNAVGIRLKPKKLPMTQYLTFNVDLLHGDLTSAWFKVYGGRNNTKYLQKFLNLNRKKNCEILIEIEPDINYMELIFWVDENVGKSGKIKIYTTPPSLITKK